LKINMITAMAVALIGIVLIVVQSRRHPAPENSPYLPGRAWSPPTPDTSDTAPSTQAGPASPNGTGHR
ncbi:prolipoprotein diacylglyceryl transferase, partial [Cryobacterium sp. ZS14-85]|nr:prolipoprotein diacylglyceryl transferase [Cryobacterium zhongshanensis]